MLLSGPSSLVSEVVSASGQFSLALVAIGRIIATVISVILVPTDSTESFDVGRARKRGRKLDCYFVSFNHLLLLFWPKFACFQIVVATAVAAVVVVVNLDGGSLVGTKVVAIV